MSFDQQSRKAYGTRADARTCLLPFLRSMYLVAAKPYFLQTSDALIADLDLSALTCYDLTRAMILHSDHLLNAA